MNISKLLSLRKMSACISNLSKKIFIKILFFSCLVLFCYPQTRVWANGIFLPEFIQGAYPLAANLQEVSKVARERIASDRCIYQYNAAHELVAEESAGVRKENTYDQLGNLIQTKAPSSVTQFAYNPQGLLSSVKNPSQTTNYVYDALGRKTTKTLSSPLVPAKERPLSPLPRAGEGQGEGAGATALYLYDGLNLAKEITGATTTQYLSGPGTDEVLGAITSNQQSYFLSDALGTVTAITDPTQKLKETFNFDAFGNALPPPPLRGRDGVGGAVIASPPVAGEAIPSLPQIFAGHQMDPETGMYNARSRQYAPNTGRFISPDPLSKIPNPATQLMSGPNPYTYVRNNPARFVDPMGLFERDHTGGPDPFNTKTEPTPMTPKSAQEFIGSTSLQDAKDLATNLAYAQMATPIGQAGLRGYASSAATTEWYSLNHGFGETSLNFRLKYEQDYQGSAWTPTDMPERRRLAMAGVQLTFGSDNRLQDVVVQTGWERWWNQSIGYSANIDTRSFSMRDILEKAQHGQPPQPPDIGFGEQFVPGSEFLSELEKTMPGMAQQLGLLGVPGSTLTGHSPWGLPGGGVMSPEEGGVGTAAPGINTPVIGFGNQGQNDRKPPTAPAKRETGQTVLGQYPGYEQLAEASGDRYFKVPPDVWKEMSPDERWAANQTFLDRTISRGDEIILSTRPSEARGGSSYERELEYLMSKGYTLGPNELSLIKKDQ